jgi:hypothetical protein
VHFLTTTYESGQVDVDRFEVFNSTSSYSSMANAEMEGVRGR